MVRIPAQGNLGWKVGARAGLGSAGRGAGVLGPLRLHNRGVNDGTDGTVRKGW